MKCTNFRWSNVLFWLAIGKYKPTDGTTNPSLLLAASKMPEYKDILGDAVKFGKENGG